MVHFPISPEQNQRDVKKSRKVADSRGEKKYEQDEDEERRFYLPESTLLPQAHSSRRSSLASIEPNNKNDLKGVKDNAFKGTADVENILYLSKYPTEIRLPQVSYGEVARFSFVNFMSLT